MPRDTLRHVYPLLKRADDWYERVDIMQRHGMRKDFGGFADVLAWHVEKPGVLAIQSCTESHMNPHKEKLEMLPRVGEWVDSRSRRLELWVWAKRGAAGKEKLKLRVFRVSFLRTMIQFEETDSEVETWDS